MPRSTTPVPQTQYCAGGLNTCWHWPRTAHRGNWTGYLTWRGQWASHWNDQQAALGVRVAF
jgi:hypothetical protein